MPLLTLTGCRDGRSAIKSEKETTNYFHAVLTYKFPLECGLVNLFLLIAKLQLMFVRITRSQILSRGFLS